VRPDWDRPGAALEDDEPDEDTEPLPAAAAADTSGPEPGDEPAPVADVSPAAHLCPGCGHVQMCGVAAAIVLAGMGAGSAGDIVISKCGEFVPERALRSALDRIPAPAEAPATGARAIAPPYPPAGTLCSVCRTPQFNTPGGLSCNNGHGGAPSL
jgi:hypothetical protein